MKSIQKSDKQVLKRQGRPFKGVDNENNENPNEKEDNVPKKRGIFRKF
jgi:hypothetical protein